MKKTSEHLISALASFLASITELEGIVQAQRLEILSLLDEICPKRDPEREYILNHPIILDEKYL